MLKKLFKMEFKVAFKEVLPAFAILLLCALVKICAIFVCGKFNLDNVLDLLIPICAIVGVTYFLKSKITTLNRCKKELFETDEELLKTIGNDKKSFMLSKILSSVTLGILEIILLTAFISIPVLFDSEAAGYGYNDGLTLGIALTISAIMIFIYALCYIYTLLDYYNLIQNIKENKTNIFTATSKKSVAIFLCVFFGIVAIVLFNVIYNTCVKTEVNLGYVVTEIGVYIVLWILALMRLNVKEYNEA